MDRIDPLFYTRSTRIDLKEETRIKATSEEAAKWTDEQQIDTATPPNFISNIFFLTVAMSHYGYLRTISTYEDMGKHRDDLQRHMEQLQGDGSWMGVRAYLSLGCSIADRHF
jgi:ubiquitin conjugation factor E4 B